MTNKRPAAALAVKQRTLEFFVISAQELKNVKKFRKMKAYAVAYVDPNEKVRTRIDEEGEVNPTWDEKLSLSVDEDLLEDESAQLTIDIYAHGTFRDKLVGTVRVLLADAVKASTSGNRFPVVSYLVFRSSGDPQGLLNLCIPPKGIFPHSLDSLSFRHTPSINAHSLSFGNKSSVDEGAVPKEEDSRSGSLSIESFTSSDENEEISAVEVNSKSASIPVSESKASVLPEGKPAKSVRTR